MVVYPLLVKIEGLFFMKAGPDTAVQSDCTCAAAFTPQSPPALLLNAIAINCTAFFVCYDCVKQCHNARLQDSALFWPLLMRTAA